MTKEPYLVVMAAGMGSRFGGLKQVTPIDNAGNTISDYSLFDAKRAGFKKVVFVIKHAIEADFREKVGEKAEKHFEVKYVFQELDSLTDGFSIPSERVKPWGTAHAIACCSDAVDAPFAVVNADDFYGENAYKTVYSFLKNGVSDREYGLVGFKLKNTLTENGSVARGVCETENGYLTGITERTKIYKRGEKAEYTEDGEHFYALSPECTVSMNMWAFPQSFISSLKDGFRAFLRENNNPLKGEYFLPTGVSNMMQNGVRVRVLPCSSVWYGMTYREDLSLVSNAVAALKRKGDYPELLL